MKKLLLPWIALALCFHLHAQSVLKDIFGRDLSSNGIVLVDWEGYIANPAIKLSLTPPAGVIFPYTVNLTANHARLYFNEPSTTGPDGPAKTLVFNSSSPKDFYISIFPDREAGDENYMLTLNSLSGTQTFAIKVIDQDPINAVVDFKIDVDFSNDNPAYNFFNNSQENKDIVQQAAEDWAYFFAAMNFDTVAAGDEQTWIWEDDFAGGNWQTNATDYNGFLLYAYGIHTTPHRSGGEPSTHAFQTVNGHPRKLRRSGGYEAEVHGNYNTLGYNNSINDDTWYLATNLGDVQNDLYSIAMHEIGHALGFNPGYPNFSHFKNDGYVDHLPSVSYQNGYYTPVDEFDHISNEQAADSLKYVDRISKRGAFGSEYANIMPRGRWLISKVNLLTMQAIGYNLKSTTPFIPVKLETASLPNGITGTTYNQQLSTQGGVPFYNYTIYSGNLPDGLTLDPFTGLISGIPSVQGNFNFTVRVYDYDNRLDTKSLFIHIGSPTINADFTADVTTGCGPLTVQLMNQSSNGTSFAWTFYGGVPSTSTLENPIVSFPSGVFDVQLSATNSTGSDVMIKNQYIKVSGNPTIAFTINVNGMTVNLTNTGFGGLFNDTNTWDFGDGQTGIGTQVSHIYETGGTYTITLTVSNPCGSVTETQTVLITEAPTAAFSADTTTGCSTLVVHYENQSLGDAASYYWTFDGGSPSESTAPNPTVYYFFPGNFPVSLTVTNSAGTNTAVKTGYVKVKGAPNPHHQLQADDLTIHLTYDGAPADSILWLFGDGASSTEFNPEHTYSSDGSYNVFYQVTNECGTRTSQFELTVASPPTAAFYANNSSGCAPLAVEFNNASSENATDFAWIFEGGTPSTSTEESPMVSYASTGIYDVTLIASNALGADTFTYFNYILVENPPEASFTATANGLVVNFTNTSSNATSYQWSFGEGSFSTEANPTFTYPAEQTYNVLLTANNSCGSEVALQTVSLFSQPTANFSADTSAGCFPLTVHFTSESSANAQTFLWNFEGGSPAASTEENPTVFYLAPGIFSVDLTVSNSAGQNTQVVDDFINVSAAPTANFSFVTNGLSAIFTNSSSNANAYSWDFGDGQSSTEANPTHVYDASGTYTVVLSSQNECGSNTAALTVVVMASGIEESLGITSFNISPNPNNGRFWVEISGLELPSLQFELFNPIGQSVGKREFGFMAGSLKKHLDFGDLPSGIYHLRVQVAGQSHFVKLVVE